MNISLKRFATVIAISIIFTATISYFVYGLTPSTTFIISEGFYPGATDFTVWQDSPYWFVKNHLGQIMFSGSNFTTVMNNVINGLPTVSVQLPDPSGNIVTAPTGSILIKRGQHVTSGTVQIPLGSRITIYGEGTTQQMIGNGVNGGTQIVNNGTTPVFECLHTRGAIDTSGTELILKNVEFVQNVNLDSNETACVNLDGMSQGILENVQVVKKYGSNNAMIRGTGISCVQEIGGDHVGGQTLWLQVGIMGFNLGFNCSIHIFKGMQIDIANCSTALRLENHLSTKIESLHVFQCSRILALYGGFTTYGHVSIEDLYLEECGGGEGGYEWYVDPTFHSYCRIYNTNVNVGLAATLWRCNDNESLWFEDVMVTGGAAAFPTVTTPGTTQNQTYVNENMQVVEVFAEWNVSTGLYINNNLITDSDNCTGTFYLRPGDYISIDSASYNWHWRAYSADRGRQDDV